MGIFNRNRGRKTEVSLDQPPDNRPHFVRDYERLVDDLEAGGGNVDELMSTAVGGQYERVGGIEADIMSWAGLRHGTRLLGFGCGSGRLATALSRRFPDLNYTGIDIVQRLLDYARTKTPSGYKFVCSQSSLLPCDDASFDMIAVLQRIHPSFTRRNLYLYGRDETMSWSRR